jgi:CBS domain-containing protein
MVSRRTGSHKFPLLTVFFPPFWQLMVRHNIGSLIVVDENNKAESMLSERDYLDKIVVLGRSSRTTRVEQIMSEKALISVHPDEKLVKVMELMTDKRVRHVPVIAQDGSTVGLVSIGDVVKEMTASFKRQGQHMESYLAGSY